MTQSVTRQFELGLALSGAISAGAYTAGVLDFLVQALDEWEKARGDKAGTPQHRVVLSVMAGASAGAITGALGAVALARGIRPTPFTPEQERASYRPAGHTYQTARCVLPSLYDTWVTSPSLTAPPGKISFLTDEDLRQPTDRVQSLLNGRLLDHIKDQALGFPAGSAAPSGAASLPRYEYVSNCLHIYMTFSNLRGIPFTVPFGNSTYGMQSHADRAHYAIVGLGTANAASAWAADDQVVKPVLSVATLPSSPGQPVPQSWDLYGDCALASAAFPIGLAPRQLTFDIGQYSGRRYPIGVSAKFIDPKFPDGFPPPGAPNYVFLNVDGGMINNNPFDYAQYALMGQAAAKHPAGNEATKAVIMVSPFPEPPAFLPDGQPAAEIVSVLRALFPAMINQLRFKLDQLEPAADEDDHSRYLIAPERNLKDLDAAHTVDAEERYTIACGLLGGFGGFLDERFRAHDFQLGRRNCQQFLLTQFGLPVSNPIAHGMQHMPFRTVVYKGAPNQLYTIIPLLGEAAPVVPLPHWPRMATRDFDRLLSQIMSRLKRVGPAFIRAQTTNLLLRTLALLGLWSSGGQLRAFIRRSILCDLVRRDQIEGWELPATLVLPSGWTQDDVRAVLAELIDPSFNLRTAQSIAARIAGTARAPSAQITEESVGSVLDQLCRVATFKPFRVRTAGEDRRRKLYALPSQLSTGALLRVTLRSSAWTDWIERLLEPLGTD